jgi:hypothetical protein
LAGKLCVKIEMINYIKDLSRIQLEAQILLLKERLRQADSLRNDILNTLFELEKEKETRKND